MNGQEIVTAQPTTVMFAAVPGWIDRVAARMIQRAARSAPQSLSERLEEEWLADLAQRRGRMPQLRFALGCYWAATVIRHDHCTVKLPATSSPTGQFNMGDRTMTTSGYRGTSRFPRRATSVAPGTILCDINITPLIDVMLVLLVTLIISLPIMTHAVKLDLPQTPSSLEQTPPEVVDLDIDFDGTVVWNGTVIASLQQLESYFHSEAQKDPQSQIHLRPDRRVKYEYVAKVLAAAQRNRMNKMGFVNTAEFKN
jgi:biopolymer transport protein ExbD